MASPSNNRNRGARPTGGKAGGRAGKPNKPIAGTKDKTVRVPKGWNAQTVDPTNNRGSGQRPTGGQAGGRAGRPSGSIARPATRPSPGRGGIPANYQMLTNPTQNRGAGQRPTGGLAGGRAGKPSGPIARPNARPTGVRAPRVPLLDRALLPLAVIGQAADVVNGFKNLANHPFLNKNKDQTQPRGDSRTNLPGGRSNRTSQPQRPASQYENLFDPGGSRSNYGLDKPQAVAPLPTSVRPSTTGAGSSGGNRPRSGGTGGTRRSSTPSRPSTPTPAKPGQKWDDFNPNRGTSKSNNPLLDRDKGGIKLRDRMKQREDTADKSAGPTKDGKEYGQFLERQRDRNDQAMGPMKDSQAYGDYLMRRKKNK